MKYDVVDEKGEVRARLDDQNNCPETSHGWCGECDNCLMSQATHAGFVLRPVPVPTCWDHLDE